ATPITVNGLRIGEQPGHRSSIVLAVKTKALAIRPARCYQTACSCGCLTVLRLSSVRTSLSQWYSRTARRHLKTLAYGTGNQLQVHPQGEGLVCACHHRTHPSTHSHRREERGAWPGPER